MSSFYHFPSLNRERKGKYEKLAALTVPLLTLTGMRSGTVWNNDGRTDSIQSSLSRSNYYLKGYQNGGLLNISMEKCIHRENSVVHIRISNEIQYHLRDVFSIWKIVILSIDLFVISRWYRCTIFVDIYTEYNYHRWYIPSIRIGKNRQCYTQGYILTSDRMCEEREGQSNFSLYIPARLNWVVN
jgi:hypothetical protein